MNEKQVRVWEYLQENALGVDNAVHVADLAQKLSFPPVGTNNDDVRSLIREMVVTFGKPIGTCSKGVFIIVLQSDMDCAVSFLSSSNRERIECFKRNGLYSI